MNKNKQNKYNTTSKSKDWFPFKKRKFNCWESSVLNSSEKCSYKAEALLSFQERQMLHSIVSSLQTNKRDAIRISINELHRRSCKALKEQVERSKSLTKDRGHTSRNQTASFRITKDDLLHLEDIAEINSLSTKEALRLVIIWMATGIKDETIKSIKGCQEISQDEKANEWKKSQSTFKQSDSAKRLREVREFWKEYFENKKDETRQESKYSQQEAQARAMGLDTADSIIEERFTKIIEEHQLDYENLDERNQMIYYYMARYELEYKDAVWWYEDELEEMDKIAKLNPYELVQYLKKEKEEEQRIKKEMEKAHKKQQQERWNESLKERAYEEIVTKGNYKERLSLHSEEHPFSDYELQIIIEHGIRTQDQIEADLKGRSLENKEQKEKREKEDYENKKQRIRNIKAGKENVPSKIDLFWHDALQVKLWKTYDDWSQED